MKTIKKSLSKQQALLAIVATIGFSLPMTEAIASATYSVDQDVMASPFFGGADRVRGYDADDRNVHRVSSNNPFGMASPETIYLTFGNADLSSFSGPVHAELTVQSVSGGFNADASSASPFIVSAHAVNANPLTSITDDTNAGGAITWSDFYNNNIESADSAALTSINGFGTVTFDVSAIVNDWISGTNTIQAMALTGANDTSGTDFLHGFLNNSENPGSTYLTVSAVPIPSAVWLMGSGLLGFLGMSRKRNSANLNN